MHVVRGVFWGKPRVTTKKNRAGLMEDDGVQPFKTKKEIISGCCLGSWAVSLRCVREWYGEYVISFKSKGNAYQIMSPGSQVYYSHTP